MQEVYVMIAVVVVAGVIFGGIAFVLPWRFSPPTTGSTLGPLPASEQYYYTGVNRERFAWYDSFTRKREIDHLIVERMAAYFNSSRDGIKKVLAAQNLFGRRHADVLERFADFRE